MPIYEYYCKLCGKGSDEFFKIADRPMMIPCQCGGKKEFIISAPQVQIDTAQDVPWIREFAGSRPEAMFGKKTIETRGEYKKYLDSNGLRPSDGPNISEV